MTTQADEVRRLLRRWGKAVQRLEEIKRLRKAITEELDAMADIHPQQLTGMPHGTNVGRPTEENAFRRMAAESNKLDDLNKEEQKLCQIVQDAEWAISFVPERERRFLELHYLNGFPMSQVASELYVSEVQAWRIEKRAISVIIRFSTFEKMTE